MASLLPAGLVAIVVGVVVGLPLFGLTPFGLVFVVVGGLLVALSAAAPSSSKAEGARGLNKAVPPALVAAPALALLAIISAVVVDATVDVTAARANTLAEESVAVARAVTVDVEVVAFVDDDRAFSELQVLADRYRRENPRLRLERRTMRRAADSERARDLGVAEHLALGGPNVVVVAGDHLPVRLRVDAGQPDQEARITNALRRATSTSTVKLYVVAGHGEPDVIDEGPTGLSRFKVALQARGVELVPVPLARVGVVPDDARGLVVLPGTTPLTDEEARVVNVALGRGVPLLLAVDPDRPQPRLASWAAAVGVDVVDDVLVDESPFSTMLGGADVASGQGQIGHPITRPLRGAMTHFPRAALLALTPTEGLEATPLVSTGPEAKSARTGAVGPLPLVVAVTAADDPRARRTVVCADATFFENASAGQGANHDLALNAALWVSAVDDSLVVRPRSKTGALVFLTPSGRASLTFVVVVFVPGVLLMVAAAWAARRRGR